MRVPPYVLALAAILTVQLSSALSVPLFAEASALGMAWLRLALGAAVFLALSRAAWRAVRRGDAPLLIGLGIATAAMSLLSFAAIERIQLGAAVAIAFLGPLVVAAVRSPSRRALAWPGLALIGVTLVTQPWTGRADWLGILFAAGAAVGWGLYLVLTKQAGHRFTGTRALAITVPIAAAVAAPLGLPALVTAAPPWWVFAAAAGLAVLHPVLTYSFEMLALRRMAHTAYGTMLALEPAVGALLGLVILSQLPSPLTAIGIALVVVAAITAQRRGPAEVATPV